jgi:hypothetical protein
MKMFLHALTILFITQFVNAQNRSEGFTRFSTRNAIIEQPSVAESGWLNQAQSYIQKSEYFFKNFSRDSFACANRDFLLNQLFFVTRI